jgi:hypothetical protein
MTLGLSSGIRCLSNLPATSTPELLIYGNFPWSRGTLALAATPGTSGRSVGIGWAVSGLISY